MSVIVNPRDIFLQATTIRLVPISLPPNISIPALQPDPTGPPTPSGFAVSAAFTNVFISHNAPTFSNGHGYKRTNVYGFIYQGGALPVFANAPRITSFTGRVFAHPSNPGIRWHLWITWESNDGVESAPAGGINGLTVDTAVDVDKLVAAMTGPGEPFKVVTEETYLPDGSLVPVGTYTSDAYIHNGQITNAKIANLAVDDAKIATLGVAKLTAGSISVGQYITSFAYQAGIQGWAIDAAGNAEFNNATVRGTVYASAGEIGGTVIDGNGLRSATFATNVGGWQMRNDGLMEAFSCKLRGELNTGSFNEYAWPAAGAGGGAHIGPNGLLLGNYNDGSYIQITNTGNLYAPKFTLEGGNATFAGVLAAASGSFTGALTGATGTFDGVLTALAINAVQTINLGGYAVTVPLFGAFYSGVYGGTSAYTGAQYLYAGSSIIAIVNYATAQSGFKGSNVTIFMNGAAGDNIQIATNATTGENVTSASCAGYYTAPVEGYYSIWARVSGEAGGVCTQCTIVGMGAKR